LKETTNGNFAIELREVSINSIKENPDNPRVIKDDRFKKLVKSIQDFPEMLKYRPIVINDSGVVLGGNMRLRACHVAGLTKISVVIAKSLSPERQREFTIKDNLGYGDWDFMQLIDNWDLQLLDDWGLELPATELAKLNEEDDYDVPDDIDSIVTSIVIGDIIMIGRHRLVCGDSTNPQHVDAVLADAKPYLMVTDPPYGVGYNPDWRNHSFRPDGSRRTGRAIGEVKNDDRIDWGESFSLSPAKVAYVYHDGKFSGEVAVSLSNNLYEIRAQIIWSKNNIVIGRGNYHWKHEPCWYAVKKGAKAQWCGDRKQSTIWEINKPTKSETGHSTQKPIECMARAMRNHKGDVYDPFLGSGTTMVAAHQLQRICYGVELNPKYCQVIIDRMRKLQPGIKVMINGVFS
jgi:DNA modification methylase